MKIYLADTNFYLRFLLQDVKKQADETENYLKKAQKGQIKIIFLSEVIIEMGIVLEKFYKLNRDEISQSLLPLIKAAYLEIKDKDIWLKVFEIFNTKKIALLDIMLVVKAANQQAGVLSFDKNLQKLFKKCKNQKMLPQLRS